MKTVPPILAVCTLFFACSDNPPPIGTTDASKDTSAADVETDAAASDSGADSSADSSADDGATTCTSLNAPPSNTACASCIQSACCASWNECQGNSDCVGYTACALACAAAADAGTDAGADGGLDASVNNKASCYTQCQIDYPNGVNDGIVVIDCETNACGAQCP